MQNRTEAAKAFLTDLMRDGHDPETILTGPGLSDEERAERIDIDPVMETRLESLCADLREEFGKPPLVREVNARECGNALRLVLYHTLSKGTRLHEREDGISYWDAPMVGGYDGSFGQVAIAKTDEGLPEVAGIYYHTALFVMPEHRGKGIGSDLVVEHVLHNGGVLNWDLDSCAYSPGGAAAHVGAVKKLEAIAGLAPETSIRP